MDRGWNVVVMRGERMKSLETLDRPITTIGRDESCRIRLKCDGVPVHPVRLVWIDGDLVLEEPGHPDGPRRRVLEPGEEFHLGPYRFQIIEGDIG